MKGIYILFRKEKNFTKEQRSFYKTYPLFEKNQYPIFERSFFMTKQELIEYLHNSGKMPDNYYYQVNGKSAEENYIEITRKRRDKIKQQLKERQDKLAAAAAQKQLEASIEKQAHKAIEKALDDVFKDFLK